MFFKESQKYFEETTQQKELEHQSLKDMVRTKEAEIEQKDEDLKQIIVKHERDMQQIMSKGEVNIQDEVRTASKVPMNNNVFREVYYGLFTAYGTGNETGTENGTGNNGP